jgi:hypothetical protein
MEWENTGKRDMMILTAGTRRNATEKEIIIR